MGTWARRTVACLVLAVLCAAPALATTCELLCDVRARAAARDAAAAEPSATHHASSASSCHGSVSATQAHSPRVSASRTECAFHHGGSADGLVAVSPARADGDLAGAPVEAASLAAMSVPILASRASRPGPGSPPGPPLTSRSLAVLRI